MAKSFIEMKSALDDFNEERLASLKKAGDLLARNLSGQPVTNISSKIDDLLKNYSDADKYTIMKFAFMKLC